MTLRIGITGPIGCGKSTIARWLGEMGARVIDADVVAREVTAPGEPALAEVLDRFGAGYRLGDGSLDRAALGRLVFSDPAELAARLSRALDHPGELAEMGRTARQRYESSYRGAAHLDALLEIYSASIGRARRAFSA